MNDFERAEREYLEPTEPRLSGIKCDNCLEYIPMWGGYYELGDRIICSHCMEEARERYAEPEYPDA